MVVSVGAVNAGDLSLEESFLADTSNVTEEESQRITSQMRAAAYYLGNKDVTEQQAKERYQITHSLAPQQNPPPSPPTSSPPAPQPTSHKPSGKATSPLTMDRSRTAPCRAKTTALTPRPVTIPHPQPKQKQEQENESIESDPGFRPGGYVETGGRDDYWYRTSHAVQLARQDESDNSSTPPIPQSQSQSQSPTKQTQPPPHSPPQSQSQPQPSQVHSPPASPPRPAGSGLVHMLSQLSTSDTSQERDKVLALASSDEKNPHRNQTKPPGIVDYASDQSNRPIHVDPQPEETQATLLQTQLEYIPSRYTTGHPLHGSSPSLGGSPARGLSPRSSPSLGGDDRRSSPSLGGVSPSRPGGFAAMNMTGGSSPYQASSAFPTQNPESLTQEEEDSGMQDHDSEGTQGTAATQIVSPEDKYVSATPAPATAPPMEDEMEELCNSRLTTKSGEYGAHKRQATPETQVVSPEEPVPDISMHDINATEEPSLQSLHELTTPHRTGQFVRLRDGDPSRQKDTPLRPSAGSSVPPLTTPLTNPQQTYALDRSRKSAFEPPVRSWPQAQTRIRRLELGGGELSSTPTRWDSAKADAEERAAREAEEKRQAASSSGRDKEPAKPPTPAAANEVLTASTPFISGKGKGTPQRLIRSPLSPRRTGAKDREQAADAEMDDTHDTEPEDTEPEPIPQPGTLVRNQSSLPLEVGRQERLKNKQLPTPAPPVDSEPEHESEDEALPQATPQRGRGKQIARRGKGRVKGRGRGGAIGTPRTPHEITGSPASPLKSGPSTGKKRPRAGTAGDASPAGVAPKKLRVQTGSATPAAAGVSGSTPESTLVGVRVLAWWSKGRNYYFGSITGCETKGLCSILYDDGDSGTVALDRLRRGDLRVGDQVRVNPHDKSALHRGDAIVKDVRRWQSDHIVGVAMGATGSGERVDFPGVALMVPTKEVNLSWSDRMLNENGVATPPDTKPFAKRRVSANTSITMSARSGRLSGYAFVLTLKAEDVGIRDDKLEDWKVSFRTKIENHGGVVADEWDELFTVQGEVHPKGWIFRAGETGAFEYVGGNKWPRVHKVFLLSGKMGTTAKYMMALALGVPCLSHKWIDEFLRDESTPWLHALLSCGQSDLYGTLLSQVIDPRIQKEPDMVKAIVETQLERRPFGGKAVLCIFKKTKKIQKDPADKGRFFSRVVGVLGAASVHLVHETSPWPIDLQPGDFDFVKPEPNVIVPPALKVSSTPIRIDRSRMEELGMYDEPEWFDAEWTQMMKHRNQRIVGHSTASPLLVTALPETKSSKHKYISNMLADWKLCGHRDTPCRVVLAGSVGEQESKAQGHLQQIAVLARELNRTLVLPNMHKSRFGTCAQNRFDSYYDVGSLQTLGVHTVTYETFLEWCATRRIPPLVHTVEIFAWDQRMSHQSTAWKRCLWKSAPRIQWDQNTTQLPVRDSKNFITSGRSITDMLRDALLSTPPNYPDIHELDIPQVYALDWRLRHPVIPEVMDRYLTYATEIIQYADDSLEAAGPVAVIHWRMESVQPSILVDCSKGLIELLKQILNQSKFKDIRLVYLATDFPLDYGRVGYSGTFRDIGEHHFAAVRTFRRAFQPGGALESYRLVSYFELTHSIPRAAENPMEVDPGYFGIMDKVIASRAAVFIRGSPQCARNSSFTRQILSSRQQTQRDQPGSKVRNIDYTFQPLSLLDHH